MKSTEGTPPSHLVSRWIVLRAVGVVYVLAFAGIISQSQALVGPHGIAPIGDLLRRMGEAFPHGLRRFDLAPSLFWLGSGMGMILALEWTGMAAAVALVLNLWPRIALFVCWITFLAFVAAWGVFSPAQLDDLMLETALLCLPFAPAGFRPGLGEKSPPRPIALFMMRFLLFRVMFESGLIKLLAGDPHWRNFTAMDVMHETAPLPTYLGYIDHQLPHAVHVFEAALTFLAELVAPWVAVFGGRRGRWFAFAVWFVFQAGIQLTTNFGWLNVAAIALGFLLLDDQMLSRVGIRFGRREDRQVVALRGSAGSLSSLSRLWGLRAALGAQFCLSLGYLLIFVRITRSLPLNTVPAVIRGPVNFFWNFHSANEYNLYAKVGSEHDAVEFAGSDDAGRTWHAYPYRYVPQDPYRICPFLGPWFPRFDVTMENMDWDENKTWLFQSVASELVAGNPDVDGLFAGNPFPGKPPSIVRMRYYRIRFADLAAHRRTGRFWIKEYKGDYVPMVFADGHGRIEASNLAPADAALKNGDPATALAIYRREYRIGVPDAGIRLATLYEQGMGVDRSPEKAFAIYRELARRGETEAEIRLGDCYARGDGTAVDFDRATGWYRRAAKQGSPLALYSLAGLYANDLVEPADNVEGLVLLHEAQELASGDDAISRYVRRDPSHYGSRLEDRLSPDEISAAEQRARERVRSGDLTDGAAAPAP